MMLLVRMKTVSFMLWKKLNELFGQPNIKIKYTLHIKYALYIKYTLLNIHYVLNIVKKHLHRTCFKQNA